MEGEPLLPGTAAGLFGLSPSILTTWGLMAALAIVCGLLTRRLQQRPDALQAALEGIVGAMAQAVQAVLPQHSDRVLPFIATLWIYLVLANLSGVIPGVVAPTEDLSVTSALALLVFSSVHWFGIRTQGLRPYLRHYLSPSPVMLPFHLMSEVTRTVALAVRLFGNMLSMEMAALLVLLVAGLLVPVPLLMLHLVEALVQAYIFGMLALIYVAGGIQQQLDEGKE